MSLTSALRPSSIPFNPLSARASNTATGLDDSLRERPFHHEPTYINLNRMLIRFQHLILLIPSPSSRLDDSLLSDLTPIQKQIQADLWSPLPYHRTKWLHNIEGARTLLLRLERAAQQIKVQRLKRDAQRDLAEKRGVIKKLRNRIEEIQREVESMGDEAWKLSASRTEQSGGESVYDMLRQRTAGSDQEVGSEEVSQIQKDSQGLNGGQSGQSSEESAEQRTRSALFDGSSTIRNRGQRQAPGDLPVKGTDTAQTSGFSNIKSTERALLDSSRTQETLTTSLVSMAAQLKQQSKAFQFALDQDKGLLDRALEGLDRNISGMEAASKNMAFLKRMSEGEGWWGRMKLYAMIFGMWIAAILLVFVAPKLRF